MEINLKNIEEIIFFDKNVQLLMPEFRHLFDQWRLSHRVSGLGQMAKHSIFELMNSLETVHIEKLEEHFGEKIFINKLNKNLVEHYDCNTEDCNRLCEFSEFIGLALYRNGNDLKFTFWR